MHEVDENDPNDYILHTVIVHSGPTLDGGHYYSYIRSWQWNCGLRRGRCASRVEDTEDGVVAVEEAPVGDVDNDDPAVSRDGLPTGGMKRKIEEVDSSPTNEHATGSKRRLLSSAACQKLRWYKFEDDMVRRAKKHEVFEGTFGGDRGYSSAYYLVYVRKSRFAEIMGNVTAPERIRLQIEEEEKEAQRIQREKDEESRYMYVRILQQENFAKIPVELMSPRSDMVIPSEVRQYAVRGKQVFTEEFLHQMGEKYNGIGMTLRVLKESTVASFHDAVAKEAGMPVGRFRLWRMEKEYIDDKDYKSPIRPGSCLTSVDNWNTTLWDHKIIVHLIDADAIVYVEKNLVAIPPVHAAIDDAMLVFLKYYPRSMPRDTSNASESLEERLDHKMLHLVWVRVFRSTDTCAHFTLLLRRALLVVDF